MRMENCDTILIQKLQKSQSHDQAKLITMNILPVKTFYLVMTKKIIEQAKFIYSLLGKAFEKQIKTVEDQGEKQIKAIQNQRQIKAIKKYAYSDEDSLKVR